MSWKLCCALIAEFLVYSKELMLIPAILHGNISTSISYLTKPNIGNGNRKLHFCIKFCASCVVAANLLQCGWDLVYHSWRMSALQ